MNENQLAALTGVIALSVLITLIAADNKSWLWRKAMFAGFGGYIITALLFWLNRYTVPDLKPGMWFVVATAIMLLPVALNYVLKLRGPVVIPDAVMDELEAGVEPQVQIQRYMKQMTDERDRKIRTVISVTGGGLLLIAGWFGIVHVFGLAEDVSGQQESFTKVLVRLVTKVERMDAKVDTLVAAGARREARITKLEEINRRKARVDSLNTLRLLRNQNEIMTDQDRIKARLKPKAVPQVVPPIKPRRWWEIGYHPADDSLTIAKKY